MRYYRYVFSFMTKDVDLRKVSSKYLILNVQCHFRDIILVGRPTFSFSFSVYQFIIKSYSRTAVIFHFSLLTPYSVQKMVVKSGEIDLDY